MPLLQERKSIIVSSLATSEVNIILPDRSNTSILRIDWLGDTTYTYSVVGLGYILQSACSICCGRASFHPIPTAYQASFTAFHISKLSIPYRSKAACRVAR